MSILANAAHEAFCQARFAGQTLTDAYQAAGFENSNSCAASRLARQPEIQERIAELYRERATETVYDKASAVRDLLTIIHTPPSDATDDHPLCEVRMGKDGPYHRFPPKLQALARLIKLMNWDQAPEPETEAPHDPVAALIKDIRLRKQRRPKEPLQDSSLHHSNTPSLPEPSTPPSLPDSANLPIPSVPLSLCVDPSADRHVRPRHEAFAAARVRGLGVMAAYHAAGFTGGTPNCAWRINNLPEVQARISKLNGGVETLTGYRRDDAIRDLITIVRARPSEATVDHPLCETRMTAWGSYHRFPSKIAALTLLARLHRWHRPAPSPDTPPLTLEEILAEIISRRRSE